MSREEDTHLGGACEREHFTTAFDDPRPAFHLSDDADLHVVDEQGQIAWNLEVLERARDRETKCGFHGFTASAPGNPRRVKLNHRSRRCLA
jgi:hypothetical protein